MKSRKSDWLGHITWRGERRRPNVSILEILDKRVRRLSNLATIHSYIDLRNESQASQYIVMRSDQGYKKKGGTIQKK